MAAAKKKRGSKAKSANRKPLTPKQRKQIRQAIVMVDLIRESLIIAGCEDQGCPP